MLGCVSVSDCNSCPLFVYCLERSESKVVARHFGCQSESLSIHTEMYSALFDMLHTIIMNNVHRSVLPDNYMYIVHNIVPTVLDFLYTVHACMFLLCTCQLFRFSEAVQFCSNLCEASQDGEDIICQ